MNINFFSANCNDIFEIHDQFLNVIKDKCVYNIWGGTVNTTITIKEMNEMFEKYSECINTKFNAKDFLKDMAKSFKNKDSMFFIRTCEKVYSAFFCMDELVENLGSCLTKNQCNELRIVPSIAKVTQEYICSNGKPFFNEFFIVGTDCINKYKDISRCIKSNTPNIVINSFYLIVDEIL